MEMQMELVPNNQEGLRFHIAETRLCNSRHLPGTSQLVARCSRIPSQGPDVLKPLQWHRREFYRLLFVFPFLYIRLRVKTCLYKTCLINPRNVFMTLLTTLWFKSRRRVCQWFYYTCISRNCERQLRRNGS